MGYFHFSNLYLCWFTSMMYLVWERWFTSQKVEPAKECIHCGGSAHLPGKNFCKIMRFPRFSGPCYQNLDTEIFSLAVFLLKKTNFYLRFGNLRMGAIPPVPPQTTALTLFQNEWRYWVTPQSRLQSLQKLVRIFHQVYNASHSNCKLVTDYDSFWRLQQSSCV